MEVLKLFLYSMTALGILFFLLAAISSLYLRKVVQGWRGILQAAHPSIDTWQRSHIQASGQTSTSITDSTSGHSLNDCGDITDTIHGRYFGLSSTPVPEHHTSICSSPTESRKVGYLSPGHQSVEQEWLNTSEPGQESNHSAPVGAELSPMPASTLSSSRKKKCRLCSRVRRAVFGES